MSDIGARMTSTTDTAPHFSTIPIPPRMAHRPTDRHGHPVPWFVAWIDGQPDFRVIGPDRIRDAVRFQSCWLCGEHLGSTAVFVIGPMCVVNRTTAEPGSHKDCADYAIRACPFMTRPQMRRRDTGLPNGVAEPGGTMLTRNPGAGALYAARTKDVRRWSPPGGGQLFALPDPQWVSWWVHGRPATRIEAETAVASGLPALEELAREEGTDALAELGAYVARARAWLPA
jgi:hypothetical protein